MKRGGGFCGRIFVNILSLKFHEIVIAALVCPGICVYQPA